MTAPYMPPPAKKSRLGLVLALVIGSLILATIGSAMIAFKGGPKWPDSKPSRSPEAMPQTDAALATYYDQKLSWSPCGSGNECAKLTVPLDYDSPDGRTIKLALLKVRLETRPSVRWSSTPVVRVVRALVTPLTLAPVGPVT